MHVQSCCFADKTYCFLTFSLPSAPLDSKVPNGLERGFVKHQVSLAAVFWMSRNAFDSVFRFRFRFPCFNAVVSQASPL